MKLEMRFSEANSSFDPQFDEGKQAFGVSVGEVMTIYGGGDTLFVTVDYDTMTASHTPAEMAEHIANGGKVFVALDGEFAAVSACNEEMAAVVLVIPDVEGGTVVGTLTVDADKAVSVVEISAGGGITVDDALDPNSTNPLQNKVVYEAVLSVGQKAAQAYNTAEGAGMAATAAQTIANGASNTAKLAKSSAEAAELKALQAQNAVTELNTAMSAVQEWQGVVENMAEELSESVSTAGGVAAEAHTRIDELETKVNNIGSSAFNAQSAASAAHTRIGELETTVNNAGMTAANAIEGVSAAHERIDALDEKVDGLATGGGDCNAIIDVVELPTENINEQCFYRLLTGTFVYNQYQQNGFVCHCVNGLPETGEPATDATMSTIVAYYNTQDGEVYGYVDAMLSQGFGIPVGWYPASMLFQVAGVDYSGVITYVLDDPLDNTYRLLLEYVSYSHKDEKWTSHKTIGWVGDGKGAEVFNHPSNKAYGLVSHAEGRFTVAGVEGVESYGAHAEGRETKALADASHAEGDGTTASGDYSHAEGTETIASGYASHAEGDGTTASGIRSHAEGTETIASGYASHVQGKYNIEDAEDKYAHIVGNGDGDDTRSNAHTLDWNGLGWFAGGLKVGGTGQDDPNAEEILTKSQVQALIDEAIAKLNL